MTSFANSAIGNNFRPAKRGHDGMCENIYIPSCPVFIRVSLILYSFDHCVYPLLNRSYHRRLQDFCGLGTAWGQSQVHWGQGIIMFLLPGDMWGAAGVRGRAEGTGASAPCPPPTSAAPVHVCYIVCSNCILIYYEMICSVVICLFQMGSKS